MLQVFRMDVKQANILKPMPIQPWKLISASALQGPAIVTLLVWPIAALFALLFGISGNSYQMLIILTVPFAAYLVSCAQAPVAILYFNSEDHSHLYVSFLLSNLVMFFSIAVITAIGAVLWFCHAGVIPTTVVVAVAALVMSAAFITLSAYLYRCHDPTSD